MLTVITGPPCSGKTTYAREHAKPGDLVIDFDQLAQALGSPDTHDHPSATVYVTRAAWQTAVRAAIGCHHRGARVWLIDTEPSAHRRHQYSKAGAKVVTLTAPAAELHRRATEAGRPPAWHVSIDKWLTRHDDTPQPASGGLRPW